MLEEIATHELKPFGLDRVTISDGGIVLDPRRAISIGMVLHELATNAAKYGALSNAAGRISLVATARQGVDDGGLSLTWKETGGPSVTEPPKTGFGIRLVHNEMRHTMKGNCQFSFEPDGLKVILDFPYPKSGGEVEDGR